MRRSSRTGFFGVRPAKRGRFVATFEYKLTKKVLGTFDTAEQAARAHDAAVRERLCTGDGIAYGITCLNYVLETDREAYNATMARREQRAQEEIERRRLAFNAPVPEEKWDSLLDDHRDGVNITRLAAKYGTNADRITDALNEAEQRRRALHERRTA